MGKLDGFVPREGELDVSAFLDALEKVFELEIEPEPSGTALELAPRPPALCAGCSHRATFYSMKKVFGKDAIYPSDIGCYTLGIQSGTVETTLCMGSSISIASGLYHAGEKRPICCSIGDSTFFHTGMNSLLNAIVNKAEHHGYNSGQPNYSHDRAPAKSRRRLIRQQESQPYRSRLPNFARQWEQDSYLVVDPYRLEETQEAFKAAKEFEGTAVVIARQPCVISGKRAGIK